MSQPSHILAIDQGTTSTRAILYDRDGTALAMAQRELRQIFPRPGWVEHDAEEIWQAALDVCRRALSDVGLEARTVAAIGITNQRETAIVWDRETGKPIHNAIVWQDRRTAERCRRLTEAGKEDEVRAKTGLLLDPYFSATKIGWMLDTVPGARKSAEAGALAFGTVESFLLWRLSGGTRHVSDATNASRTLLYDIHRADWDDDLCALFEVPRPCLPEICDNAGAIGIAQAAHLGAEIPICGMAGDQQAALIGQACFRPGMVKSTYGTGCFALMNTGPVPVASANRLLTTVAYRLDGQTTYALEGSIFSAGSAVQWLRDGLGVIENAAQTETMAAALSDNDGVYMVPAFTGLGAPRWDADARGAIVGLTRAATAAHLARAALEAVAYQTAELIEAMADDAAAPIPALRVDGGMVGNDWLMQFLTDILAIPIERPKVTETTAFGAACLAGLGCGLVGSLDEIADRWRGEARFRPAMAQTERGRLMAGWRDAVARVASG